MKTNGRGDKMDGRKFKQVLITGVAGSGGSYMAENILENHPGVEVHGLARSSTIARSKNLTTLRGRIKLHPRDLNYLQSITDVLMSVRPDAIFHIASDANVRESFDDPVGIMQNNAIGAGVNFFEAIRFVKGQIKDFDPVVQHCSTSEVYGRVNPDEVPIKETQEMRSSSPYGVSKIAQDHLARMYFENWGIKIIRTRMFSYLNPRRRNLFATSFAMQVAEVEMGLREELLHGNLDSVRTIIDVRDAMESYWVAAEKCRFGEAYNIGGKKTISVGDFLGMLKKLAKRPIPSRVDPNLLRPTDVTLQIPDTSKFESETGWSPKYSFEESVEHLLDHCRKEVKQ